MDVTVTDSVFGEMTYKHRWFKFEILNIFGENFSVNIVAKAFSGKSITDEQREAYAWFKENFAKVDTVMTELATSYINENCQEFAVYWSGARMVNSASDLAQILTPKSVIFAKDGGILVLFDCPWDEHGIAIQLKPDVDIGSQDMFL